MVDIVLIMGVFLVKSHFENIRKEENSMIQLLICDDNPSFVSKLHNMLTHLYGSRKPQIDITDIINPLNLKKQDIEKADIIFLDVDMGNINGIALARYIRSIRQNSILIYVTNYMQYAPEGYEVNAFRYLAKSDLDEKLPLYFDQAIAICAKEKSSISIFCDKVEIEVPLSNLIYAEVYQKTHSLLLHMHEYRQNTIITKLTINALEEKVHDFGFLRIHKSFLVNMRFIQNIQSISTQLKNGQELPTSARNYQLIKAQWLEWKGSF